MGKTRSPNRDKAFEIYKEHNGKVTPKEISALLEEKAVNVYAWKRNDEWDVKLNGKVGAPFGNKNAVGNNGGAPKGNENRLKNGKYRKYIPKTVKQMIDDYKKKGATPIDILRENIFIAQGKLIDIMASMNKEEGNIVKKQGKGLVEYITEHEQSIDITREFTNLTSQITKMIREYESLTGEKYNLELEEKRAKIKKLKTDALKNGENKDNRKGNLDKLLEVFNKGPAK